MTIEVWILIVLGLSVFISALNTNRLIGENRKLEKEIEELTEANDKLFFDNMAFKAGVKK